MPGHRVICIIAAAVCLWVAVTALLKPIGVRWSVVLVAAFALLLGVIAVDPVGHLDNRYSGWFGDP